jgi:predicted RNase H-like nuclease (RuvC/YqgF family)
MYDVAKFVKPKRQDWEVSPAMAQAKIDELNRQVAEAESLFAKARAESDKILRESYDENEQLKNQLAEARAEIERLRQTEDDLFRIRTAFLNHGWADHMVSTFFVSTVQETLFRYNEMESVLNNFAGVVRLIGQNTMKQAKEVAGE